MHAHSHSHRGWASAHQSHHHSSALQPGRARLLLLRAAAGSAAASLAAMAAGAGTAHAKSGGAAPAYPPRVEAVLQHLRQHPMAVTSASMQYDAEPTTPLPACIQGLTPADVLPQHSSSSSSSSSHMARVIAGLLFAACGGLDAAHNLVTPLCWGSWTAYAGQPIAGSPAAREAAHVHAIVHRQEGRCDGEFGSGFKNAVYWYRAAGEDLIAPQLFKAAQALAAGKPKCEAHMARHGSSWRPATFVALCDETVAGSDGDGDGELRTFCERMMAAELHALLEHCYARL